MRCTLHCRFFTLTTAANILLVGTLAVVGDPARVGAQTAILTLSGALVFSLLNWLLIEPKCTSLMFERCVGPS